MRPASSRFQHNGKEIGPICEQSLAHPSVRNGSIAHCSPSSSSQTSAWQGLSSGHQQARLFPLSSIRALSTSARCSGRDNHSRNRFTIISRESSLHGFPHGVVRSTFAVLGDILILFSLSEHPHRGALPEASQPAAIKPFRKQRPLGRLFSTGSTSRNFGSPNGSQLPLTHL